MEGFFFIPATKLHKLDVFLQEFSYQVIIDFEDAVLEQDRAKLFSAFLNLDNCPRDLWIRLPLKDGLEFKTETLRVFIAKGFYRFVMPKLVNQLDYERVLADIADAPNDKIEFILLVEYPLLLLELKDVLANDRGDKIKYLALGSHDLLTVVGAEHNLKQLSFPRTYALYCARAYGVKVIDIASMNIGDEVTFKDEVLDGIASGFDAKFLLHPKQIDWFEEVQKDSQKLKWAEKILKLLPDELEDHEIEPFVLDGEVIEKAHVQKAIKIIKNQKHYEK